MKVVLWVSGEMKQIEMGEAITGLTTYETTSEAEGYFHSWGRGWKSFIPATVFCPQCSKLREHNPKTGKVDMKRNHDSDDFCWDIIYDKDEETFGRCNNCGHDMRTVEENTETFRGVGDDHTTEQEWVGEGIYESGYFWLSQEDYKSMFQVVIKAHKQKLNLAPAILVGGSGYILNNQSFLKIVKEKQYKEQDNRLGIPRQCWQSL